MKRCQQFCKHNPKTGHTTLKLLCITLVFVSEKNKCTEFITNIYLVYIYSIYNSIFLKGHNHERTYPPSKGFYLDNGPNEHNPD